MPHRIIPFLFQSNLKICVTWLTLVTFSTCDIYIHQPRSDNILCCVYPAPCIFKANTGLMHCGDGKAHAAGSGMRRG